MTTKSKRPPRVLPVWESALLSSLAPAIAVVFTNPFDTAKVRLQLQGEGGKGGVVFKNSFDCMWKTYQHEGIKGLQRGLVPAILRESSKNLFRLGMFDPIMAILHNKAIYKDPAPAWKRMLAGGICGAMGAVSCNPFELVKTRLQAQAAGGIKVGHQHNYTGVVDAITKIIRSEGFWGLYKGSGMSVARSTLGTAANLTTYSALKEYLLAHGYAKDGALLDMFCGLTSGFATVFVMNPVDVLRTRYYNQPVSPQNPKVGLLYKSGLDAFFKVLKAEGVFAFYKGFTSHFLRIGPHFCLTFMFLGVLKRKVIELKDHRELLLAFRAADTNGNGQLDADELFAALLKLLPPPERHVASERHQSLVRSYVARVMAAADSDRSGTIEFSEYARAAEELREIVHDHALRALFDHFDRDGSGEIDESELANALEDELIHPGGPNTITEELRRDVRRMIAAVDADRNGQIDFEEFKKLVTQLTDLQSRSVLQQWMLKAGIGHE